MARDLSQRVVVITGASSGIGAASALACGRVGMDVVIAARRYERLAELADKIEAAGGRAAAVRCDVDQPADVDRLFEETLSRFGRIDVLFANAGRGLVAPVLETTEQMFKDLFETNFYGTLRCVQGAVTAMRGQRSGAAGGHILICSSCVSEISLPRYGAYCATKAAQDAIAQSLRAELAGERISVSSVHPVTTETEFFERAEACSSFDRVGSPSAQHKVILQSADHVAKRIVRCLRKPCPEVWPHPPTRYALALCTAFPRLAAWAMRRMA